MNDLKILKKLTAELFIKTKSSNPKTNKQVGFSDLADESQFIKTFHFWIFSCLTKLLPCLLLTFFTTVLIR